MSFELKEGEPGVFGPSDAAREVAKADKWQRMWLVLMKSWQ